MMIKRSVAVLIAALLFNAGHAQTLNSFDGPYVSYHNDRVIVRYILDDSVSSIDSFSLYGKKDHPLVIRFSDHTGWDFAVTLRDSLRNEPCQWDGPAKILALSDIEGEFEAFRGLLIANRVMDSAYRWTFGRGHLVICGDLFDRGQDVNAELWLLYKLEDEARAQGGYVHTILGNHEIMNLSGDLRYVRPKYFDHARRMGLGYADLYDKNSELGRWLRGKNIIERMGDNLCLHGGISPAVLALRWPVDSINARCRPFYDQALHPEKFPDKDRWGFFDGRNSPFWYRGYFLEPRATDGQIDSTLALYQCKRIVVGHTIVETNVGSYYSGRVIGIDVNQHEGRSEGLLIEADSCYKIDLTGKKQLLGR